MDLNKLKVPELRDMLKSKGLDSKGNKPVLIERLREAIERENAEKGPEETEENEENEENEEEEDDDEASSEGESSLIYTTANDTANSVSAPSEPVAEERAFSSIANVSQSNDSAVQMTESNRFDAEPEKSTAAAVSPRIEDENSRVDDENSRADDENSRADDENSRLVSEDDNTNEFGDEPPRRTDRSDQSSAEEEADEVKTNDAVADEPSYDGYSSSRDQAESEQSAPAVVAETNESMDASATQDSAEVSSDKQEEKVELMETEDHGDGEAAKPAESMETNNVDESSNSRWESYESREQSAGGDGNAAEVEEVPANDESAAEGKDSEEPKKRVRKSRFDQPGDEGYGGRYEQQTDDRKRKHSPSGDGSWGAYETPPKIAKQDEEPEFDENAMILSWFESDLNLTINTEKFVNAVPFHEQGFMYMWAGVRGTYGFNSGKIYYDIKLAEKCALNVTEEFELFAFRVGWSLAGSSLQLGEAAHSYGYDSSGKKCVDGNFEDYGQPFNPEDVVGCFVDFDSDENNVLISFTHNGTKLETAFEVSKESLEGKALFPHILTKNISYEVNFGEREELFIKDDENFKGDFEWASKVAAEQRVRGPKKPAEKKDCEMILVCGLPCSGKTTWVKKHVEENPDKLYNVISVDSVLSKMQLTNDSILDRYKDNTDVLAERCTRCMNRLIDLASVRWRNYILDQTNVYCTVQRRKARCFDGFTRKVVVVIPSESDYEEYSKKFEENPIRDTAASLVELKDNFRLPEDDLFDSVVYVGLEKEEAEELVKKYNREGRDARPRNERPYNRFNRDTDRPSYGRPPMGQYRSRWNERGGGYGSSMSRGGGGGGGGGGGWGPRGMDRMPQGGGGGGFRDRRNWRDRSPDDSRDGYRSRFQSSQSGGSGSRFGGGSRWGGRDDRSGPPRGSSGYSSGGERKSRFDDPKRRDDQDGDDYRSRVGPSDDDGGDSYGEDGKRERRSRFSDDENKGGGFRSGGGGFRGSRGGGGGGGGFGGGSRGSDRGGRGGYGAGRPQYQSSSRGSNGGGMGGGRGGFNRGRDDGGSSSYYGSGGRGGGPPRRDNRDGRTDMGQRQGMNRFGDKNDSGNKGDSNTSMNAQSNWGMYGASGWNQAAAAQYQNWAQYQAATGYTPQQIQQYWAQMQQQQQQSSGNASQSNAKSSGGSGSASGGSTSTSQSGSNNQTSGYNAQGYNTPAGYDPNTYAQYYAQYYNQLAQQGWTQQPTAQQSNQK